MSSLKILALAGSTREKSLNKMLVRVAGDAAKKAGALVTFVDLRDFPIPLYDGDLEEQKGMPENAHKLRELFIDHQGILLASPEYNSSISAVLKNAIDWISRPLPGEPHLVAFAGKMAAVMSASMGQLGGLRGLVHTRAILENIGVFVVPKQICIAVAHEKFNDKGELTDSRQKESVVALAQELVACAKKLCVPIVASV